MHLLKRKKPKQKLSLLNKKLKGKLNKKNKHSFKRLIKIELIKRKIFLKNLNKFNKQKKIKILGIYNYFKIFPMYRRLKFNKRVIPRTFKIKIKSSK